MIDLHMHSTFSDGSYTPEELVEEGVKQGLTAIALTDHDSTNGIPRFLAAAEGKPIRTISGVEVSADFRRGTMHMLGYGIHHEERELNEHLKWIRSGRESRNQEILHLLNKLGFHITWHEVQSYAGEDVVGRPHFAAAMVEKGYVASRQEAFDRYLGKGKPAYAERRRLSPSDTIRLIRGAGGVPVLAHPFTLNLGRSDLRKLIGELTREGLLGIEVFILSIQPECRKNICHLHGIIS